MKWNLHFLENQKMLVVNVSEQFSLEDQKKMFEEIASSEQWRDGISILFDNRKLTMNNVDGDEVRMSVFIVKNFCNKYPLSRIAGLVSGQLNFGLGRQFETYSEIEGELPFQLFKDESLAIEWLKE